MQAPLWIAPHYFASTVKQVSKLSSNLCMPRCAHAIVQAASSYNCCLGHLRVKYVCKFMARECDNSFE